jgi:hypothetical protein
MLPTTAWVLAGDRTLGDLAAAAVTCLVITAFVTLLDWQS